MFKSQLIAFLAGWSTLCQHGDDTGSEESF